MSNPDEFIRQNMKKEGHDELNNIKLYLFLLALITIILPFKMDFIIFNFCDSLIADRNAKTIAAEISKNNNWIFKWRFRANYSFFNIEVAY